MNSPVLIATAIYSFVGMCLNGAILYLLLTHGRRAYHYVFALIPLICAIWDLGVLLEMIRNAHPDELARYGQIISYPAILLGAAMLQFAHLYTGRASRWLVALVWILTLFAFSSYLLGFAAMVDGSLSYPWGNIHKSGDLLLLDLAIFAVWYIAMFLSIASIARFRSALPPGLPRRHATYILLGFTVIPVATIKLVLTMGVDAPLLLPFGMALTDFFAAVMAVAILKDRMLDITVIVKKTALYSALAAAVVIAFSLCEHILASYIAEFVAEGSDLLHIVSVAVVIALALPLKNQFERLVDRLFAKRALLL
ncbi:MAG: hypothetical protein ACM3JD_10825 [Rudaea sp.]